MMYYEIYVNSIIFVFILDFPQLGPLYHCEFNNFFIKKVFNNNIKNFFIFIFSKLNCFKNKFTTGTVPTVWLIFGGWCPGDTTECIAAFYFIITITFLIWGKTAYWWYKAEYKKDPYYVNKVAKMMEKLDLQRRERFEEYVEERKLEEAKKFELLAEAYKNKALNIRRKISEWRERQDKLSTEEKRTWREIDSEDEDDD